MFIGRKYFCMLFMLLLTFRLSSVTLFEIKDESGNPVLIVDSEGLTVMTWDYTKGEKALGDTLMTIRSSSIRAHIRSDSKALARSFSVTTSSSSKGGTNVFYVNTNSATMREASGNEYTSFGPDNIFLGLNAGSTNTTGSGNTFMGNDAGTKNESGNSNVIIGDSAGKEYNGSFGNVFIGQQAAENLKLGQRNVILGYSAGSQPLETHNSYGNVFIGGSAARKISGSYNVIIGEQAGENHQAGGSSAGYNVFVGKDAGRFSTGNNNVYIGQGAGRGESNNVNPGSRNIFIGDNAGWAEKNSDRVIIGTEYGPILYGRLSNPKLLVVNGNLTNNPNNRTFFVNGSAGGNSDWHNDSDERLKKNIKTIDGALEKVQKLRGVTFEWKETENREKGRKMGFIAQESKNIIPEVVDHNLENDSYTMQYASVTALLVEAVKELRNEFTRSFVSVTSHEQRIDQLIKENEELKRKVSELEELRAEVEQIRSIISGYAVK